MTGDWAPPLPPGRAVELPGRGTTFIRELGDRGAPTLVLLHGWTATADLNWFTAFDALASRFHVVAMDHRGHGQGIRARRAFRLADCADDVAALADVLGIETFVPVGYSMGGPISLLTWHRHPHRVRGLVLCATAARFGGRPGENAMFSMVLPALRAASAVSPFNLRRRMAMQFLGNRVDDTPVGRWVAAEMRRSDGDKVLEAGMSLGRFDAVGWLGEIDVPTVVVRTLRDMAVPPDRQTLLAERIPGATIVDVDGDHSCVVTAADRFVPALVTACEGVTAAPSPGA